jgi:hypothetical protein
MPIAEILLALFALSVPALGLIVLLRLLWTAYRAVRASRMGYVARSVLASVCLVALSVAVATIWFAYALAHSAKDGWSDLQVALLTGIPFYVACYALWRMAGRYAYYDAAKTWPAESLARYRAAKALRAQEAKALRSQARKRT